MQGDSLELIKTEHIYLEGFEAVTTHSELPAGPFVHSVLSSKEHTCGAGQEHSTS